MSSFLAITKNNSRIRSLVVYEKSKDSYIGCYGGYAGGGITDYRFFLIDKESNLFISDDETEIDGLTEDLYFQIIKKRNRFIDWDNNEDGAIASDEALKFFESSEETESGLVICHCLDFDMNVIHILQEEWGLLTTF